jgi:hypothetical protein
VERSQVTQVDFEADTDQPRQMVRIRYDSYANLVARGVIREPVHGRPSRARPILFPGTTALCRIRPATELVALSPEFA